MSDPIEITGALKTSDLPKSRPLLFSLAITPDLIDRIKTSLDLQDLRKLRLTGQLAPKDRQDWHLTAKLGATAVQSCIATGAAVVNRVDCDIERFFIANWASHIPQESEAEMPEDDRFDPLGEVIDLEEILTEALALALPDFPRDAQADPVEITAHPPGTGPIDVAETRPFAALADLKRKMDEEG
ncbi:MAG: DUF177 domain-containing protein [Pseudomonadota bacterium]